MTNSNDSINRINGRNTDDNNKESSRSSSILTNWYFNWIDAHFIYDVLTTGISSSIAITAMAPLERAKLILQVQHLCREDIVEPPYKNFSDVIRRIVQEQGFRALWRGNTAGIIRCFPYQALGFAFKAKYQSLLSSSMFPTKTTSSVVLTSLLAGGIGASTALSMVYPLDRARTKMALNMEKEINVKGNENPEKKVTLRRTLLKTYRADGIPGLYRGFCFSVLGVFVYRSIYFGLYDTGKFITPDEHRGLIMSFLQAELAASISGLCSYPFDTVRRSIMVQKESREVKHNARHYIVKIFKTQGITGFYHGAGVNIIRGTGGALMLVFNDYWQDLFFGLTRPPPPPPPPPREVAPRVSLPPVPVELGQSSGQPRTNNNSQQVDQLPSVGAMKRSSLYFGFCGIDRRERGTCDF